jgi:hypothetical protein
MALRHLDHYNVSLLIGAAFSLMKSNFTKWSPQRTKDGSNSRREPPTGAKPRISRTSVRSAGIRPDVQDEPLLGHPVSENALGTTLYHGTLLANLEDIISQGLIPGGRRTSRRHVHFAEDITRIRDGSEIVIEVKTSAMFLITQKVYKS